VMCWVDVGFEEITRLLQPSIFGSESKQEGLAMVPTLTSLNVEGNDITGDIIDRTCLVSRYDCQLSFLNLSSNPLSSYGHDNVASIVQNNQNVQHLLVNSCGFDLAGLISLSARLYENHGLLSLSMDRPLLTKTTEGEVTENLSRIVLQHNSLEHLSMKYHAMPDLGARLLADSLFVTQRMITLNLECNKIGVAGAEALASALLVHAHRSLQYLGLSYNFVSDDGAIALAEVIDHFSFSLSLSLCVCVTHSHGVWYLIDFD
jgi:NLR family CARD domain-containing protein 3